MNIYASSNHSTLVETGRMLRQFRESKGWTLAEMSKKLGMREEQILAIEEGKEDHFKKMPRNLWRGLLVYMQKNLDLICLTFSSVIFKEHPAIFKSRMSRKSYPRS